MNPIPVAPAVNLAPVGPYIPRELPAPVAPFGPVAPVAPFAPVAPVAPVAPDPPDPPVIVISIVPVAPWLRVTPVPIKLKVVNPVVPIGDPSYSTKTLEIPPSPK